MSSFTRDMGEGACTAVRPLRRQRGSNPVPTHAYTHTHIHTPPSFTHLQSDEQQRQVQQVARGAQHALAAVLETVEHRGCGPHHPERREDEPHAGLVQYASSERVAEEALNDEHRGAVERRGERVDRLGALSGALQVAVLRMQPRARRVRWRRADLAVHHPRLRAYVRAGARVTGACVL
eukprot:278381-Chlamydomonas_euryale.AAC.3